MNRTAKILLPILVLIVGVIGAGVILRAKPKAERRAGEVPPRLVRAMEVTLQDLTLTVVSQGTVAPRTESTLVAQVAGRIESVAPSFAEGGFFRRGEVLVRIEAEDYRLAAAQTAAQVAQAQVRLDREEAEADLARQEWEELGEGDPSPLTLHVPQLAEAKAAVQASEAALAKAELDLSRTTIRAPFDGRVRHKQVDLGQYVGPGTPVAGVYATDAAEIRLPVSKDDLAFLPPDASSIDGGKTDLEVRLVGDMGGRTLTWTGRIVRTGSELDPRTRMLPLFARVDDPAARLATSDHPPLPIGLYVTAEIVGGEVEGVAVVPRSALREGNQVLVVDAASRLRFREVSVLRREGDRVIVDAGLEDGEVLCVSSLDTVVEGMEVRAQIVPAEVEAPAPGELL